MNMSINVTPLDGNFAAIIDGPAIATPLADADFDAIHQAFLDHKVVTLRGLTWDFDTMLDFGRRFGRLVPHVLDQYHHPKTSEVSIISANTGDKTSRPTSEPAGAYWHSDLSYDANPADAIMLYAREVPSKGGDTEFCDTVAAYAALPAETKARIDGMIGIHRYGHRGGYAVVGLNEKQAEAHPDVRHPVVRTHRETGRKSLFVSPGFTAAIEGLPAAESDALLQELFDHMLQPRFRYRHKWQVGDLVCADNRSTMHCAVADYTEPRRMWRMIVGGSG
jgi:taurine dioxygenase